MSELLMEFLPDHEPNERFYRLVTATLEAMEEGNDLARLLRYFETWLLRLGGFFPDPSRCAACGESIVADESSFLTVEGAPRCHACSGGRGTPVDSELRTTIREMFKVHPTAFARKRVRPEHVAQISEINYQIIRHALERDLRSRALLKQLSTA
jgi:DNA repair protein RecO